jgi:hypothetical protein
MKKDSNQDDLKAVAQKHGWTYELKGSEKYLNYTFTKNDVTFSFNRRGLGGECVFKIWGQALSPEIFFDRRFFGPASEAPADRWLGPLHVGRAEFADRVLARFDRKKLLDTIENRMTEICSNLRGAHQSAEDDLAEFQNYRAVIVEAKSS